MGANFEILGYEKEDTAVILGFLKENIELINKNRDHYKNIGTDLLQKRKEEKIKNQEIKQNQAAEKRLINMDEIKELMQLSKKYDISNFIRNTFKKTLWETITLKEFEAIKANFKEE